MKRVFTGLRALVYAAGLVALWTWLAFAARGYDSEIGVILPGWAPPVGVVFIASGALLALASLWLFITRGRGTPAPFDPPREFVAEGPYRYVRNPMYVGALSLLFGFSLWSRSLAMLALTALAALLANLFVALVEEPGLERRFGASYRSYKKAVRRWLPRQPDDD